MSIIGDRTRARRIEIGISQEDLARLVGATQQSIAQLEGDEIQRPRYLVELSVALGVSIGWLQGKTDDPAISPREQIDRMISHLSPRDMQTVAEIVEALVKSFSGEERREQSLPPAADGGR